MSDVEKYNIVSNAPDGEPGDEQHQPEPQVKPATEVKSETPGEQVTDADGAEEKDSNSSATESENEASDDADGATPDDEESGDEADEEVDVTSDAFVENMASKLTEIDGPRFEGLQAKFVAGEEFEADDYKWIGDSLGYDEAAARYVISLQRESFEASKAADTSLADAEAELGTTVNDLVGWATNTYHQANPERVAEWQNTINFAQRSKDDALILKVLKEISGERAKLAPANGGRPKTLAHLASSQAGVNNKPSAQNNAPVKETSSEPPADTIRESLSRLSDQALSAVTLDANSDPAVRARAVGILKDRGVIR